MAFLGWFSKWESWNLTHFKFWTFEYVPRLARNIWLNYEGRRPQPENAYGESERLGLFLGVSDAFCWLSNIYIFDKLLNFDYSNINVMREACLYYNWSFVPIFFENLQGINEMSFLGGGGGDEEWRVGGWGLSPKFSRMRVSLIH